MLNLRSADLSRANLSRANLSGADLDVIRWDENTKSMYYTGAGHEHLLVYKSKENKVYKVKTGGVALGMVKDSSKILKEQQIAFDPNDIIILYTDGITEARYRSDQNGILFGIDRIVESVMKC